VHERSNGRKAKEKYRNLGMRGSRETIVDITVYSERQNGTTGSHEGTRIWKENKDLEGKNSQQNI